MRRFLFGFLLALAIAIPATLYAAPPKTVTVTNPMTANLDAAGFNISNVGDYLGNNVHVNATMDATDVTVRGGKITLEPPGTSVIWILSGDIDPSAAPGVFANPGSLYVGSTGLWRKSGPLDTDWTRVA